MLYGIVPQLCSMCYFLLKMADKQVEKAGQCVLPLSRIRTIMKSSPDVGSISHEALFLTGKATVNRVQNVLSLAVIKDSFITFTS